MLFQETPLAGAYLISLERMEDSRGFFARTYCEREFAGNGLTPHFAQCNISFNARRGTLRGMHFQRQPVAEAKLVRCTKGAACDVIIDLRKDSPTYCKWVAFELTEDNRHALYVPPGFAHGFQALADSTELFYQMSEFHSPSQAGGVRWNDPLFSIVWPIASPILSENDRRYPDFIK